MTWAMYLPHLVALVGAGGFGAALKPTFDFVGRQRERSDGVAMALVAKLQVRIDALEAAGEAERAACAHEMTQLRSLHEAQVTSLRHEVATYRSENQMLLLVLEMAPEKSASIIARLRQQQAILVPPLPA